MQVFWGMKIFCDISVVIVFLLLIFFCVCVCFFVFVFFLFWGGECLEGWLGQGSAKTTFDLCLIIQSIKHQVPFHVAVRFFRVCLEIVYNNPLGIFSQFIANSVLASLTLCMLGNCLYFQINVFKKK